MNRRFNDTGVCIPKWHYMVDISPKIKQIIRLVEYGDYFVINRPRQYGKTTTLQFLWRELLTREDYVVVRMSFEVTDADIFDNEDTFANYFVLDFNNQLQREYPDVQGIDDQYMPNRKGFAKLAAQISDFVEKLNKKVVILIDEVDKSCGNQLFLHFLGMLRDMYLVRDSYATFQSVVLAGVNDIKTIKLKLRSDEKRTINSPWNIAIDFEVDMSFQPNEIAQMLRDYAEDKKINMDIPAIAEKIRHYTSGYPFLVSKICKSIDEKILPKKENQNEWTVEDVEKAVDMLCYSGYTTTLFDDLFKNLYNTPELYQFIFEISINGYEPNFAITDEIVNLAAVFGIIRDEKGKCVIHNRIFEQKIYHYFLSRQANSQITSPIASNYTQPFVTDDGLDIPLIFRRFQQFMKENYANKEDGFLERQGRLLFLSFLRPILNGTGYDFKEPNVGEERRMDIVIVYEGKRYVIELKIWRGELYNERGLKQLSDYLDLYELKEGFLLIYDFRKNKEYLEKMFEVKDKKIFAAWV